jgi:hypothetical protein
MAITIAKEAPALQPGPLIVSKSSQALFRPIRYIIQLAGIL